MNKLITIASFLLFAALGSPVQAATGSFNATETASSASSTEIIASSLSGGIDSVSEVRATGSFGIDGGAGSVVTIEVDGIDILGTPVLFNQANLDELAIAVAARITSFSSGYTAFASSNIVTVTAPVGSGASANSRVLHPTGSISIEFNSVQDFSGGADGTGLTSAETTTGSFSPVSAQAGADVALNIGGTAITLTLGDSGEDAASSTAAQINADNGNLYSASVVNADQVRLVAKASGAAGNAAVIASDLAYNAVAQAVTFAPTLAVPHETFRAGINDSQYEYLAQEGDVAQDVVEALAPLMDGNAAVACAEDDVKITCTSEAAGTPFAYSALVTDAPAPASASAAEGGGGASASSRTKSGPSAPHGEVLGAMAVSPEVRRLQIAAIEAGLQSVMLQFIELLKAELAGL